MKTTFYTIILIVFQQLSCFAQKDSNNTKLIFSLGYGIGLPLNTERASKYAATTGTQKNITINTLYGNTAIQGNAFNGSLSVPILSNNWSIVGLVSYYKNNFENEQALYQSDYISGSQLSNLKGTPYKGYNFLL